MSRSHVPSDAGRASRCSMRWHVSRVLPLVVMLSLVAFVLSHGSGSAQARSKTPTAARTVWLQVMDSCQQAIPGARFRIAGNGLTMDEGPAPGTGRQTVNPTNGNCPLQRGDCAKVSTGCLIWNLPIPATGSAFYQISELAAAANYVPCTGGSVCTGGPLSGTLIISSNGAVSATIRNVYPDGTSVNWPTSGNPYTATQTDPIAVHNFELGNISCDGDGDADDHLTGSPGSHCDAEGDRH